MTMMIIGLLSLLAGAAQAGRNPPSAQMKSVIMKAADAKLIDGASARYKWPAEDRAGALYCGWVNAKNRMGGYSGWSPFAVVGAHQDGPKGDGSYEVVEIFIASEGAQDASNDIVPSFCAKAGFDVTEVPVDG